MTEATGLVSERAALDEQLTLLQKKLSLYVKKGGKRKFTIVSEVNGEKAKLQGKLTETQTNLVKQEKKNALLVTNEAKNLKEKNALNETIASLKTQINTLNVSVTQLTSQVEIEKKETLKSKDEVIALKEEYRKLDDLKSEAEAEIKKLLVTSRINRIENTS